MLMKTILHWFRRDLRVADNVALSEAARRAEQVVPVYIFEPDRWNGTEGGAAQLTFLLQSIAALRRQLAELGYPLVIRRGQPEAILPALAREVGAQAVFANKIYEPDQERCDERITAQLLNAGVGFELFKDAVIGEEQEILTQAGKPYTVFTPYAKAWKAKPIPLPRPKLVRPKANVPSAKSDLLPASADEMGLPLQQHIPPGGEPVALALLRQFLAGPVHHYSANRDFPALEGTSNLSPHLHFGTIGIRTVLAELKAARGKAAPALAAGSEVFLNELIWREFYMQVLHNFPHVTQGAFRREYDSLAWSENLEHFAAWCAGRTGYPIVDAALRCLNATGTLHNRLRMIVAMFLTKDLLLSWQWGERYFRQQLVDGDLAANNGGWQWSAGTGTDAAPYFRIFNPVSQARSLTPKANSCGAGCRN